MNPRKLIATAALTVGSVFGAATCYEPSPYWDGGYDVSGFCRENPEECYGDIGGDCVDDFDCIDGFCCQSKNCGGGMCTYRCDTNADCPNAMSCEHGNCFFACNEDRDCGTGQKCEHGHTICEYGH